MTYKKLLVPIVFLLIFFSLSFFYTRGILLYDEGWILNPAERIAKGQLPYRDFHYIYTPGVAYFIAAVFKLFGTSVLVTRLATMAVSILTSLLIYKIGIIISGKKYLSYIAVIFYLAWGPMQINFAWPATYAIFAAALALYALIKSNEAGKSLYLLLTGLSVFLVLFFKQNFGFAVIAGILIYFLLNRGFRTINTVKLILLGFLLPIILFTVYFHVNAALLPFLADMRYFMVDQFLLKGLQTTPFIYPDVPLKMYGKFVFYTFPAIISIAAVLLIINKPNFKKYLIIPVFTLMFYAFGIRPTTDYTHLVPLLAFSSISVPLVCVGLNKRLYWASAFFFASVALLGIYLALFRNYYRWEEPIYKHNYLLTNPRALIWVSEKYSRAIPYIKEVVDKKTKKGDPIFVYYYAPLFYTLLDRSNPTRFEFAPSNIFREGDVEEIRTNLNRSKTKIIITHGNLYADGSDLSPWIMKNFEKIFEVEEFSIWERITF